MSSLIYKRGDQSFSEWIQADITRSSKRKLLFLSSTNIQLHCEVLRRDGEVIQESFMNMRRCRLTSRENWQKSIRKRRFIEYSIQVLSIRHQESFPDS